MEYWILCKHLGKQTQPCLTNFCNWIHITQDKALICQYGIVVASNRISSYPSDCLSRCFCAQHRVTFPLSPWVPKAAGRCHHTKCQKMVLVIVGRREGYFPVTFCLNRHAMCLRWGSFSLCLHTHSDLNCWFRNWLSRGVVDVLVFPLVLLIFFALCSNTMSSVVSLPELSR